MATCAFFMSLPWKPRNPSLTNLPLTSSSSHLKQPTFKSLSFSTSLGSVGGDRQFFPGCLSMNTVMKPTRLSVVCMARRYGSNTRKRMIKSRRRGGDPDKKRKRKRKSPRKKKDTFKIVRLASTSGSGYVYAKRKGKGMAGEKLEIKKYDPNVQRHVVFKETK